MRKLLTIFILISVVAFFIGASDSKDFESDLDQLMAEHAKRSANNPMPCFGRLTLTSGTAVTTADVTAATTVYFTPYNGSTIGLFDGFVWIPVSFTETSVAVPSVTTTPFDIFGYNNSGTLALETVNWTNDTTRATALTKTDGVYVKSGTPTRRYLGTGRTTTVSGQTEDSKTKRFLWNYYNREERSLVVQELTDSWSMSSAAWRSANSSTTNRVQIVVGVAEAHLALQVLGIGNPNVGDGEGNIGIGENSTSTVSGNLMGGYVNYFAGQMITALASYEGYPAVGYSYFQWVEATSHTGDMIFYGGTGNDDRRSGLTGYVEG